MTQIVDELPEIYNYHDSNLCGKQGGIRPMQIAIALAQLKCSLTKSPLCFLQRDLWYGNYQKIEFRLQSYRERGWMEEQVYGRHHNPANLHASYNQIIINLFINIRAAMAAIAL